MEFKYLVKETRPESLMLCFWTALLMLERPSDYKWV